MAEVKKYPGSRDIPADGERIVMFETEGYVLDQNRPSACRITCICGKCNGTQVERPGVVERIIYYADNSIEARVKGDDGVGRVLMLEAPSGDVCF